MKAFTPLLAVIFLSSSSAFSAVASTPPSCAQNAIKVAQTMAAINHSNMDISNFKITTKAVAHPNDANEDVTIKVYYWAPTQEESAAISYTAVTIPSGSSDCSVFSITEGGTAN